LKILLTGAAGFIGSNLFKLLHQIGHEITAIDSLQPSYGGNLPIKRLEELNPKNFYKIDLSEITPKSLVETVGGHDFVIHLAAYPGVRNGELRKDLYFANNVKASHTIFEYASITKPKILFYASSSSVYGDRGEHGPCSELSNTFRDLKSYYATTKYLNEIQAFNFSRDTKIPTVGLRFFTVYGNLGRPDMAYAEFARKLLQGKNLEIFGNLNSIRDYTYIEDVIDQLDKLISQVDTLGGSKLQNCLSLNKNSIALNLGLNNPVTLQTFITTIARHLEKPLEFSIVDAPKEDSKGTCSDTTRLESIINIEKRTPLDLGIQKTLANVSLDWIYDLDA
jgi:UDP-glucuronate 4-epimerase